MKCRWISGILLGVMLCMSSCCGKNPGTNDAEQSSAGAAGAEVAAGADTVITPEVAAGKVPTESSLLGMHSGYAFIPIGDAVYRYSVESGDVSGVVRGVLLYECTEETITGETYDWQFYELEGYPGHEKLLATGANDTIWAYSPATGSEEGEIEETINDGLVILENASLISGKALWEAFYQNVQAGVPATVDLAYVYRDDPERMSEELREATIEDDPSLFLKRLTYDGTTFLIEPLHKVDGEYVVHEEVGYDSPAATWQCLMHYEGESPYDFSLFTYYDIYVLTNRDDVTWEELQWGMLSSTAGDYIPYEQIYGEYTWREEAEQQ